MKLYFSILIITFSLLPFHLNGQSPEAEAKLKSQFIYGFTKYIGWPNQDLFREFKIGVLGRDTLITKELSRIAESKTIAGKPIIVKQYLSIDEISRVQLLYVNHHDGYDIESVFKKIEGKNILLVTENYPYNVSMINFVSINNQQKFELNEERLKGEKLMVESILIEQAITSRTDWQKIYQNTENQLKTEKEKVSLQKEEISQMQEEQLRQQKAIQKANAELAEKQTHIETQRQSLKSLMIENEKQQKNIKDQLQIFEDQKKKIREKNEELEQQQLEVKKQGKVLEEQTKQVQLQQMKIDDQEKILDSQLSALEKQRIIFYLLGTLLVLFAVFVFVIYRGYKLKQKANKLLAYKNNEIETEKEIAESLLLNILPKKTAEELKTNGKATARSYKMASVMFTDFEGFTEIAETLPPQDLVKELDTCFIAFDNIIEKYHLEKIKTIGDSYMCAGGVPIRNKSNAIYITLAALEIQQFMNTWVENKKNKNLPFWETRLGIHTGSITAGVVGKKKFAYDIWGDAVNVASRMESNSMAGKINISGETYEHIKDYFDCEHRGKIAAKGKGELDMYFVKRIKQDYSKDKTGLIPNEKFEKLLSKI